MQIIKDALDNLGKMYRPLPEHANFFIENESFSLIRNKDQQVIGCYLFYFCQDGISINCKVVYVIPSYSARSKMKIVLNHIPVFCEEMEKKGRSRLQASLDRYYCRVLLRRGFRSAEEPQDGFNGIFIMSIDDWKKVSWRK